MMISPVARGLPSDCIHHQFMIRCVCLGLHVQWAVDRSRYTLQRDARQRAQVWEGKYNEIVLPMSYIRELLVYGGVCGTISYRIACTFPCLPNHLYYTRAGSAYLLCTLALH